MEYTDIAPELRDAFNETLAEHLTACLPNLIRNKKHGILPMVAVKGALDLHSELERLSKDKSVDLLPMAVMNKEENTVIGLVAEDGRIDVDRAYDKAIRILRNISFDMAWYSYSTKAVTADGRMSDALKTILIDKSGIAMIVFTPYKYIGFLKKNVEYKQNVLGGVIENIFDGNDYN